MQETQEMGSISGLARSPGVGNSNQLQYSCLENFMDSRVWQATVQGVTKSQTQKDKYHMVLLICGIFFKRVQMNLFTKTKKNYSLLKYG